MDLAHAWGAPRGRLRAGGADAVEKDGGWLVVGVLGDELAFEGFLEDGLAQAGGTALGHGDLRLDGFQRRHLRVDPVHDPALCVGARKREPKSCELATADVCLTNLLAHASADPGPTVIGVETHGQVLW